MRRVIPVILATLLLLVQSCEHKTIRNGNFAVHGIDVSHHQSYIRWDSVANEKLHFAFVKATEGATLNDSLYCTNWAEMKRIGLIRGAYHFFRPRTPAEDQIDNFINWVDLEYGDLPPVLDVELLDGVTKVQLITGMRTWLYLAEVRYGTKPIIYTNLKFYNKFLAGQFDDYPLWIARYSHREPVLACGRDWDFWQYGSQGRLGGIAGDVDFNVFRGDSTDLANLCLAPKPVLSADSESFRKDEHPIAFASFSR